MPKFNLLTVGNPKTIKGQSKGFLTFILHLAPAKLSGYQVCAKATEGCETACLNTAGRGGMFKKGETTNVIQLARIRKTKLFFENRPLFMEYLRADIIRAIKYAEKLGLTAVFRLNGTSDIAWEKIRMGEYRNTFEAFPDVQFYDYTKIVNRKISQIPNYSLTFSRAESNALDTAIAIEKGLNVAVVFKKELPATFMGRKVINGDDHDLRFLDEQECIVGLIAKGRAKKDTSGFVVA